MLQLGKQRFNNVLTT